MIKLIRWLVLVWVAAYGLSHAGQQILTIPKPSVAIDPGSMGIEVTVSYDTDPADLQISGAGISIYFDSDKLTFVSMVALYEDDLISVTDRADLITDDLSDGDGDSNTDKRAYIEWSSVTGEFPAADVPRPVALFRPQFDAARPYNGRTTVNFVVDAMAGHTTVTPAFIVCFGCFTFDIDADGRAEALTDGVLLLRHLFGFTGSSLTEAVISVGAERSLPLDIETYFYNNIDDLDIDGDGSVDALTDGLLVLRYLFGFRGETLVEGAVSPTATFNAANEIESRIAYRLIVDSDGDGVTDNVDIFPLDASESADSDGDGVGDSADDLPFDATESLDTDGDGVGNNLDLDDDDDGVPDSTDAFPIDATETTDTDGDGTGNNADADDDGDGVADNADAFPLDSSETTDTDGDGVGNNADTDDDDDTVLDISDAFPLDATETIDTDQDGIGNTLDSDDDGDLVNDNSDAFPLDSTESIDTDGDGIGNFLDTDDDGDGYADRSDAFPLNAAETTDTDGDGVGNNADTDDDGDGVEDGTDAFPLDSTEWIDADGDGLSKTEELIRGTNPLLADTDGDNVSDLLDAFPTNANVSKGALFNLDDAASIGLSNELGGLTGSKGVNSIQISNKRAGSKVRADYISANIPFLAAQTDSSLTENNITNLIGFDTAGNPLTGLVQASSTIFVAEASISPDRNYVYLLTSAHIQARTPGLDSEVCSVYQIKLSDRTYRCLLSIENGDIEPASLSVSLNPDNSRRAMDFRSDGAAVMVGFDWNRELPEGASGGTNNTVAWLMDAQGNLNPIPVEGAYYARSTAWLDDDSIYVFQQPIWELRPSEPARMAIHNADTLAVEKYIYHGYDEVTWEPEYFYASKLTKYQGDLYDGAYILDPETRSLNKSYPLFGGEAVSNNRGERLFDFDFTPHGEMDSRDQAVNAAWGACADEHDYRYQLSEVGTRTDKIAPMLLSDCGTGLNTYAQNRQAPRSDVKYRPFFFTDEYIIYRKVFLANAEIVSIDGVAYDYVSTRANWQDFSLELADDRGTLTVANNRLNGTPNPWVYQPSASVKAAAATAVENGENSTGVTVSLGTQTTSGDLQSVDWLIPYGLIDYESNTHARAEFEWVTPIAHREGFCVHRLSSSTIRCSELGGYDVRVVDIDGRNFSQYINEVKLEAGVQTQLIIGPKLFVYFKDSTQNQSYLAQADIEAFMETGDTALSFQESTAESGDAKIMDLAVALPRNDFALLDADQVSLTHEYDSQNDVTLLVDFQPALSTRIAAPRFDVVHVEQGETVELTSHTWNSDRSRLTITMGAQVLIEQNSYQLFFSDGLFYRNKIRRSRPESFMGFTFDPDSDGDGEPNSTDVDDDGDGSLDGVDAFRLDPSESLDTDADGVGNNADLDDDGDTVVDTSDAFPLDSTETVDTDADGVGDNADADDDADTYLDVVDAFPLDSAEWSDYDDDGTGDNADTDDDADGVLDSADAFPLNASETIDTDNDGIGNNSDTDDDGDGVADTGDAFPLDASETLDTDADGFGDNVDLDDDGDGTTDATDRFPLDATESVDTDGDGVGNNADTDDDGDGTPDTSDAFPLNGKERADTDSDGIGDNEDSDDDDDGVLDSTDAFPLDASETVDTDGDGTGNNADTDDDGDGITDADDDFPLDSSISLDTDSDGVANQEDDDDDGDGVADTEDAFPLDASETTDTDSDGIGDNADADDDGDGSLDSVDLFPLDSGENADTDGDGVGNNADADDDNDGIADAADTFPLISIAGETDTDGDGSPDTCNAACTSLGMRADEDDDGDGVTDAADAFPLNASESSDTDADGLGNSVDTDDDGDGYSDEQEVGQSTDPTNAQHFPGSAGTIVVRAGLVFADEESGAAKVQVRRMFSGQGSVSVDYATRESTAKSGVDYTAVTGTLVWEDGDTAPKTVEVPLVQNDRSDSVYFYVRLQNVSGGGKLGEFKTAVVFGEEPSVDDYAFKELNGIDGFRLASGSLILTDYIGGLSDTPNVMRLYPTVSNETLTANVVGGLIDRHNLNAMLDADTATGKAPVLTLVLDSIPAAGSSGTTTVTTTLYDGDDTTRINGTSGHAGSNPGERALQTSLDVNWSSDGSTVTLTIPIQTMTVTYTAANGTAIEGSWTNSNSDALTFTKGGVDYPSTLDLKLATFLSVRQGVAGPDLADFFTAGDYFLDISFGDLAIYDAYNRKFTRVQTAFSVGESSPQVFASAEDILVSERAGVAAITVTLTKSVSSDVTVDYTTVDGEAVASADYVSTSGVLTIPAGTLSNSFTVPLVDDSTIEDLETFSVALSNPSNAYLDRIASQVEILDDEAVAPSGYFKGNAGEFQFSEFNLSFEEGDRQEVIWVDRFKDSAAKATLEYSLPATEYYEASEGTLTWLDGDSDPKPIYIQLLDNDAISPIGFNIRGRVTLSNLSTQHGYIPNGTKYVYFTVHDDEESSVGTLMASQYNVFAVEEDGTFEVRVTRRGSPADRIKATLSTYRYREGLPVFPEITAFYWAAANDHYTPTVKSVSWEPGDMSYRSLEIPLIDDAVDEPDRIILWRFTATSTNSNWTLPTSRFPVGGYTSNYAVSYIFDIADDPIYSRDLDGDGLLDVIDTDDDGDGFPDWLDALPFDSTQN